MPVKAQDVIQVKATADEIAQWNKDYPNRKNSPPYRVACIYCTKRLWLAGQGMGSHRRACVHTMPRVIEDYFRQHPIAGCTAGITEVFIPGRGWVTDIPGTIHITGKRPTVSMCRELKKLGVTAIAAGTPFLAADFHLADLNLSGKAA